MGVKGVLYINRGGTEILHTPLFFTVRNYAKKGPEVILDLKTLNLWLRNWNRGYVSLQRIVGYPKIPSKDLDAVTELLFDGKINEAKGYCIDIFDGIANRLYGINFESRGNRICP